ncbi:hypothetical protein [Vibrio sonorensis]|uniref:hypothetical protein n=1 Tax=Vibrio sonorensis TaxID=1004316 RepID=UPI0008DA20D4|nr:hypothetical protein [Vibrio sonorensis]
MSVIIPPPIKIEFPEQIALSDSINGSRKDVAASELAVKTLFEELSVGILPPWYPRPCSTEIPQSDELILKGQAIDAVLYPKLAEIYGAHLPDARGRGLVMPTGAERVLQMVTGQIKSHNHPVHVHAANLGRKHTNTTGNHNHSYNTGTSLHSASGNNSVQGTGTFYSTNRHTNHSGNHSHFIDMGAHAHGAHSDLVGQSRNTIDALLVNWVVKKC